MLLILIFDFVLIFFMLVFLDPGKDIGVWSLAGLVLWDGREGRRDGSVSGLGWDGWEQWENRHRLQWRLKDSFFGSFLYPNPTDTYNSTLFLVYLTFTSLDPEELQLDTGVLWEKGTNVISFDFDVIRFAYAYAAPLRLLQLFLGMHAFA